MRRKHRARTQRQLAAMFSSLGSWNPTPRIKRAYDANLRTWEQKITVVSALFVAGAAQRGAARRTRLSV